jgi:hypothetical protein
MSTPAKAAAILQPQSQSCCVAGGKEREPAAAERFYFWTGIIQGPSIFDADPPGNRLQQIRAHFENRIPFRENPLPSPHDYLLKKQRQFNKDGISF